MNWNSIYKGILSIFILVPLIYAQNENSFILFGTEKASVLKDIGDVKTLEIAEREITQADVNIFCNLNSIDSLFLYSINVNEENVNLECLKDLQINNLTYIMLEEKSYKGLLGYIPNLESLFINFNDFNQEDLKNIISMKNLNELTLHVSSSFNVDFETITDNSNIRILNLYIMPQFTLTSAFFKIFSQVEEININYHNFKQQEVDGLKTLKNLEDIVLNKVTCYENNIIVPIDFGSLNDKLRYTNESFSNSFNSQCIRQGLKDDQVYFYVYNPNRNKCVHLNEKDGFLTYGNCNDDPEKILWLPPDENYGVMRYGENPTCCLYEDGITCGESCINNSEQLRLCTSDNRIRPSEGDHCKNDTCLGPSTSDPKRLTWVDCDNNDLDQIWYFNIWDPSVVVKETTTVYLYNAIKDECISTDGSSVTSGNCDFDDNTLWEVPNSHNGYYRSKAYPGKCLSVMDGVVSLNECNEDTTLYLDGNFIKSPSSKDRCIVSSKSGHTLEYIEGCDINDSYHIWYVNIWESP